MANYRTQLQDICPQLLDIGVSCFGYYNYKTVDSELSVHDHGSCYEICYLDKGMQPYYIHPDGADSEARLYHLYGGEVFVTHPHEAHSTGAFKQLRGCMYWIHLDSECSSLLGQMAENVVLLKTALAGLDQRIIPVPRSVSARITEAFMLFCRPDGDRLFRGCQLLCLFIMELSAQNKRMKDDNYIRGSLSAKIIETISLIEKNLLSPELSVQMIADHLHYSRAYIMTAFRKEIGMTLHEYILHKKIEYACELLEDHSIIDTALLLNFSSSQHFSRVFKERTNMTPREYILSQTRK